MSEEDEARTSFITDQDTYCYKIMPSGFIYVRTTYQCLDNKFFKTKISRNIQVYVDDMLGILQLGMVMDSLTCQILVFSI